MIKQLLLEMHVCQIQNIIKIFTNVKAVGKGSFGTVYIGNII